MALQTKLIKLDTETTKKQLGVMAVAEGLLLQNYIEQQLIAMGEHGVSYTELWNRCEALTAELNALQAPIQ